MEEQALAEWLIENGVESWNAERERARQVYPWDDNFDPTFHMPDLSYANFLWAFRECGKLDRDWPISLARIDLVEANLPHAMLRLVDLSMAELDAADCTEANLNETKLVEASLTDTNLIPFQFDNAA